MTIKNIQKLKRFGIFQNHTNANAHDFGKYNLFFGWNGSGKSTLASLFRCIENKAASNGFPLSELTIGVDGGASVTEKNIAECTLNVQTFNKSFIEDNISWNSLVKSILLVDKFKIEERKKLKELNEEQKQDLEAHGKEDQKAKNLQREISKFGTDSARRLKMSLQAIDTSDSHYLNYNKTKFESFLDEHINETKSDSPLLSDDEVIRLTNAAKPNQKDAIKFVPQKINSETFAKAKTRLDDLLATNVVSQTIERLAEHGDINSWVESGLDLHKRHNASHCEFCGNRLTPERSEQLKAHFNDDYKAFQDRLVRAGSWLSAQCIQLPLVPESSELFEEIKKDFLEARSDLESALARLNERISAWQSALEEKTKNLLESGPSIEVIGEFLINEYNRALDAIAEIVARHNHKAANFKEETDKAKKSLELHYATAEVKDFGYHEKKKELSDRLGKTSRLKENIDKRKAEIQTLERSLSNEGLGAKKFNDSLHKFLGRNELTLRFNPQKRGYELLRNDSDLVEGNLSEGEKTAIAFVYFITKLHENDNKLENTIIVVDDPVSSFDSNHLFHAYSFLRSSCNNAKQLFVLTHNFTYFKLVRDWFEGVNRNRRNRKPPKDPNAFFYTIEASTSIPRHSVFRDADSSLINYNSEYHYIFCRLHAFRESPVLSAEESFLTANLARKMLESFFCFKFPKHRGDIAQLMDRALEGCEKTDGVMKERIYRFINKYSHSDVIEVDEGDSENLFGESHNVIGDIFVWIEEVDEDHYREMIEVIS